MERGTTQERSRAISVTSHRYYDSEAVDQKMKCFFESTRTTEPKNLKTKQSRHLPYWLWYIIAKCNGIPLKKNEKPLFGTLLHTLTFAAALTYSVSYSWYVVYDILSPNTSSDIPSGTVSMILVFCYCAFGYYCKTLSSRLFCHPRFLKDVRMHSRTVFKINATILVVIIGSLFTAANVYEALNFLDNSDCEKVDLHPIVCDILYITSIVFSIFTYIWHCLVSFVFISVCRTHTIGLRRFITEIEYDAAILQTQNSARYKNFVSNQDDIWQDSFWATKEQLEEYRMRAAAVNHRRTVGKFDASGDSDDHSHPSPTRSDEISILFSPIIENIENRDELTPTEEHEWQYIRDTENLPNVQRMETFAARNIQSDTSAAATAMTPDEIMHHCWKLNCRLRFSSSALQRWLASFIALVLLRCSTYLVHWLRHVATVYDFVQFVVPLLILVVLSAAIAEVNVEGQRALRCLYPTEQRLKMMQFLAVNPLQMPIYGFGMTHGTIVTVIFAILVGFVTRIIITEMTK